MAHPCRPPAHHAARRRAPAQEYVLDFVVERKSVGDLVASIKDSARYDRQKVGLACWPCALNYSILIFYFHYF